MSKRSTGNAYEKEVVRILESEGWTVERALPKYIYLPGKKFPITKSHDFFGAWDMIAKKINAPTLWVQVSTWEHIADKRKQVQGFPANVNVDLCAIYARVRGRPPHYRVLQGPSYEWIGETWMIPKKTPKTI